MRRMTIWNVDTTSSLALARTPDDGSASANRTDTSASPLSIWYSIFFPLCLFT